MAEDGRWRDVYILVNACYIVHKQLQMVGGVHLQVLGELGRANRSRALVNGHACTKDAGRGLG